jgi:hypothetical protein
MTEYIMKEDGKKYFLLTVKDKNYLEILFRNHVGKNEWEAIFKML